MNIGPCVRRAARSAGTTACRAAPSRNAGEPSSGTAKGPGGGLVEDGLGDGDGGGGDDEARGGVRRQWSFRATVDLVACLMRAAAGVAV